jgi:Zn-dependent protease with chaperone function
VLQSLPIIGFMIVPLMLIAWKSRSVLKLKDQPAEMWGSYFHFLGRILNWLWVIWIPVYAWSNVNEVVSASLGPKFGLGARALAQVFWLAPPILVMWLCHLLSRKVYRNVRGAEWSPADVVRRAIAGVTAAFIPFLMIIVVIETWGSGSRLTATLSIVAVLGSAAVARLITRSVRYSMYSATSGELRDRIFQLAQRAGVTLKQIYVLPEGKAQLSNAFARSDSSVMVTASLLRHLSKREVDVIMAHEIGHLKEKHPQRKAAVTFATLVIVNFLVVSFAPVLDVHRWAPVMLSLGLAGATAVLHFLSRSNERHADAIGVSLTGDPEAFISGLARMSRLNLMPMHGGRIEFGTHPKTLGRLQDIARVHGIGPERLQALIAGEIAGEDHYAVNQTTESPAKIFSTAFKLKQAHRATLAILGTVILTPVLIATVLSQFRLSGPWYVIAYASGPIITGLLYLVVRNFLVGAGSQSIESQIRAKISAAGWPMAAREGWFVGLAPADCPRRYEKQTVWDLGLLWFSGNQMFYLGEETSFRLNRDEIRDARTGIIEPTLIPRNCVYVDYRDEMTSSDRTFYLVGAGSSILKSKRCTLALSERIMNWLSENSSVLAAEPNMNLAAPRFGVITSEAPKRKFQLVFALRGLMSLAILALPFCLVLRVSLAGMCYVLTMMTVIMLLDELPKLFYGRLMVHRQPQPPAYQPGSWIQLEAPARLQE